VERKEKLQAARTVWSGAKYLYYVPRAMFWITVRNLPVAIFSVIMLLANEYSLVRWLHW
jgi:hypothetical protein